MIDFLSSSYGHFHLAYRLFIDVVVGGKDAPYNYWTSFHPSEGRITTWSFDTVKKSVADFVDQTDLLRH